MGEAKRRRKQNGAGKELVPAPKDSTGSDGGVVLGKDGKPAITEEWILSLPESEREALFQFAKDTGKDTGKR